MNEVIFFMKCEMNYCIYNSDYFCTLKDIQQNSLGMCEECIIVSIPNNILEELKKNNLKILKADGRIIEKNKAVGSAGGILIIFKVIRNS